ncbi:unnamed protein product [Aphanomyces euteiches]|uniref:Pyridoxamine 5'-phosphate oxidase Alr4036 family FMN-binding domain-containing protein n=1 Tax=Aphanomyces euteiches TaxID=100861 RepID=A0A6G0X9U6_9STRA|nr:hypothetical protein Ae201684_006997 [Aphanomyces euteiches]KAH9086671.1 hypothetical protein Ae201684P_000093 [Aphanomyces euteiches]KAH9133383.1 hypothetical protein AeRB84_020518 [Aphanomyces euteiches]
MATSWTERIEKSIKKSRRIRGGNYVQLATVDAEGRPHCRTVVFRGFVDLPSGRTAMKMITDARSDKVVQIQHNPLCELVWWFSQSSEQYRFEGTLELITSESPDFQDVRTHQWSALSDPARAQFFWSNAGLFDPQVDAEGVSTTEASDPPNTFVLVVLTPSVVKYLRLHDNYAQEEAWTTPNGWITVPPRAG